MSTARPPSTKIVIIGAGFLAKYITKTLIAASSRSQIFLASRNPDKLYTDLKHLGKQISTPYTGIDITDRGQNKRLDEALEGAEVVINLVGILYGSRPVFEAVQWKGAENVARASQKAGAKLIHISAIGANSTSSIDYWRTKGLGEQAVLSESPKATIIRPSLIFGPGDGFFARFATLAKYLPFLPVFGGGASLFQPVYAGDIARAVEVVSRSRRNPEIADLVDGKIIEAGGPKVYTYKELMQTTLKYAELSRPVVSVPFALGSVQGLVMEQFPENLLTVTRSQVNQLRENNIVTDPLPSTHVSFAQVISSFPPLDLPSSSPPSKGIKTDQEVLTSVEQILPEYLGSSASSVKSGRRTHGRKGFEG
ncbi:NADH:ubiquinone oxidoreductase, NDUFA9/39kDa subunit [Phaffia rhodozyma]|uniref:NADH:ubiquinone oxidoreductase, NDUFA9/39kDa subunit n=1 Tax=Phaffia rhodozyma TaxID=264483 RepID=A0A0F7SWF4_PHARH|nr:NADH:ubiquinone oxidoreductase, NDUFA9/39kDa subunit [Phaffia rhodozyma]